MESKKNRSLSPAEAARLLRELAHKLENGTMEVGDQGAVLAGDLKVKVSGKSKDGSASLSLKFQCRCSAAGDEAAPRKKKVKPDEAGVPSYKNIKKRMSSTFKEIRAQLREGALPELDLALLFDGDAERMLHYPKKGEMADITAFRNISASFLAAVQAGDQEAVVREAAALATAEKGCHKRYK